MSADHSDESFRWIGSPGSSAKITRMSASGDSVSRVGSRAKRRRWPWALLGAGALLALLAGYYGNSLRTVRPEIEALRADASALETQVSSGDLAAAAVTLGKVRESAQATDHAIDGPLWGALTWLPAMGDDVAAARTLASVSAHITAAAQPLETALPAFSSQKIAASGGAIDIAALRTAADAVPELSQAVSDGDDELAAIDVAGLQPRLADGVTQVRDAVQSARKPLEQARTSIGIVPGLLGGDGPKSYFVMLQQDAEARGTGGLLGAYALVTMDQGRLALTRAATDVELIGSPIPGGVTSPELEELWGKDLNEWAGLNLSPHFPWTGQLVQAGWAARPNTKPLDGVVGIDGNVVAALLAGTGPVTVQGVTVSSENAVQFFAQDIYAQFPDYRDLDVFIVEFVKVAFGKVAAGQVDVPALIKAMQEPYSERRLLMWSRDAKVQGVLETMTLGGAIPAEPGPFAMPVINNGGGNKLDAYLKVKTTYEPGTCKNGVRIGRVVVQLTSTAPTSGLPLYVRGIVSEDEAPRPNKTLVDLYGPVASESPLALLDGEEAPILVRGTDRGHSVFRVSVRLDPGQSRTLEFVLVDPVTQTEAPLRVMAQPMVIPMETSAGPLPACE